MNMHSEPNEDADFWLAYIANLIQMRALLIQSLTTVERQLVQYGALKGEDRAVMTRAERRAAR